MGLSKEQCRELAKQFREVSVAIGDYRFDHWAELSPAQRKQLERDETELLHESGQLITRAVGLTLDDLERDLKALTGAVEKARKALKTIEDVKSVLSIAAAVIALAGAIFTSVTTKNPAPLGPAAGSLVALVKDLTAKSK